MLKIFFSVESNLEVKYLNIDNPRFSLPETLPPLHRPGNPFCRSLSYLASPHNYLIVHKILKVITGFCSIDLICGGSFPENPLS